jgi:hypothetical protein
LLLVCCVRGLGEPRPAARRLVTPDTIDPVWFVIDLESRRVHIAGLTRHPHDAWIQQVARN